jgi:predicted Fe-Mo cluster-binding NifX family protein
MKILIPVDENDFEESSITLLDEVKYWLLVEFEEGKVIKNDFFETREEIKDWIDVVIVKSNKEYVWPFMEENMAVLVAPFQSSVEDVMEAFLFKELHDYNEVGVNKK